MLLMLFTDLAIFEPSINYSVLLLHFSGRKKSNPHNQRVAQSGKIPV